MTTIATTLTAHYVSAHPGSSPLAGAALSHGFQAAFYVLAAIAAVGAVLAVVLLESKAAQSEVPRDRRSRARARGRGMSPAGVLERRDDRLVHRARAGTGRVAAVAPAADRGHRRPRVVAVFVGGGSAWTGAKVPRAPHRLDGALA